MITWKKNGLQKMLSFLCDVCSRFGNDELSPFPSYETGVIERLDWTLYGRSACGMDDKCRIRVALILQTLPKTPMEDRVLDGWRLETSRRPWADLSLLKVGGSPDGRTDGRTDEIDTEQLRGEREDREP